jgi:hypothetical protein
MTLLEHLEFGCLQSLHASWMKPNPVRHTDYGHNLTINTEPAAGQGGNGL